MMMKVIIVEDEPKVRKGLSEAVDWREHGMELVGTASNGQEGLELFERESPHLVICDIRMPVMDGLSMAEAVLEKDGETRILILSGYDEFEYAQRSVALGVKNYLLKPVGKKQFLGELIRIRTEWLAEKQERSRVEQFAGKLKSQLPVLRTAFLEEWLNGAVPPQMTALEENFAFLDISVDPRDNLSVAVFEMDTEENGEYTNAEARLLQFAVNNIAQELLNGCGLAYLRGNGQTVVLFQSVSDGDPDELMVWAEKTRREITRLLKVDVTVGVSTRSAPVEEAPGLFREALDALRLKLTFGCGLVLHEGMAQPSGDQAPVLHEANRTLLAHCVETSDTERVQALIGDVFARAKSASADYLEELSYQFAGLYAFLLQRLGLNLRAVLNEQETERFRHPERFRTMQEMRDWWIAQFTRLCSRYDGVRSDRKARLVQSVEDYVEEHIEENITREEAARHVHINASYLSRLFKEVKGEAFSDYVVRRKVEKAIRLFRENKAMVYEVADRLGYKDPSYFARVFKKYTGKNPSDFQ
jgi:two-component system response regulator YesN